jgi:hypothetical protein
MRVIWLRKKLAYYDPSIFEEGLTVYHGTNLPNLYLILKDGKLGSKVGRHTGAFKRMGRFYVTKDIEEAMEYAEDASRDQTYYIPGYRLPRREEVVGSLSDPSKLKEVFKAYDLYDLFVKLGSFVRFYTNPRGAVYPRVVLKLTIRKPEVLDRIYFDEDVFRAWLADHLHDAEIVAVAMMDQQFFDWVMKVFPDYRFTTTPNELAWRLAVPSTHEYYEEEERYEEEEGEAYEEEAKEEPREELPPAPEYIPEEFHAVAKRIYGALIRLAEEENRAAHLILEEVNRAARLMSEEGKKAQSFFIRGYTPLEEIEEATATVYLTNGEEREINLKSDNPLVEVEKIMEEQIQEWIRWIA